MIEVKLSKSEGVVHRTAGSRQRATDRKSLCGSFSDTNIVPIEMASTSASTIEREKEMDSLIVNLQKDANLVTKAVEKLADE